MTDAAALTAELEDIARMVPGVRQLYLAGSPIRAALAEGARMLGMGSGASALKVQFTDDSCTIEVSCAVEAAHRAGDVAQHLVETLTAACRERDLPEPEVKVTIAQIATTRPAAPSH
ncbi:hypothetical protein EII34_00600 [Arachnia propionica]|uniref:Asp23/Gls24 family envelope stress response protein n=1 Tax=Arachnia propionica TaxID=1750 RepID=A0A3P1TER5_9ACTN|nr:hypothetical protein [Arachnia propionica]MDO5082501.1 hypothetical protein [Arachnia propionica]RRD07033.1 hypothetical protein EII34_00600 [Arachnia propionica]